MMGFSLHAGAEVVNSLRGLRFSTARAGSVDDQECIVATSTRWAPEVQLAADKRVTVQQWQEWRLTPALSR